MSTTLYKDPMKIEFKEGQLYVNGEEHQRDIRKLSDMVDVFMEEPDLDLVENIDLYYMFREVTKHNNVRFDITVIPPKVVEKEYAKTFGHYHPEADDNLTYPEVYQVLKGNARFILQKVNLNGSVEVTIVDARERDVLFIPPNFGHVSINPGEHPLILSNLVCSTFSSLYEEFRKNRGAAYYYLEGGELKQNPNYFIQKNERLKAAELNKRYGFEVTDLLIEFSQHPEKFEFLEKPGMLKK